MFERLDLIKNETFVDQVDPRSKKEAVMKFENHIKGQDKKSDKPKGSDDLKRSDKVEEDKTVIKDDKEAITEFVSSDLPKSDESESSDKGKLDKQDEKNEQIAFLKVEKFIEDKLIKDLKQALIAQDKERFFKPSLKIYENTGKFFKTDFDQKTIDPEARPKDEKSVDFKSQILDLKALIKEDLNGKGEDQLTGKLKLDPDFQIVKEVFKPEKLEKVSDYQQQLTRSDKETILKDLKENLGHLIRKGENLSLTLTLNPPKLGRIDLKISFNNLSGDIKSEMIVENKEVKKFIELSVDDLRLRLSRDGLTESGKIVFDILESKDGRYEFGKNENPTREQFLSQRRYQLSKRFDEADIYFPVETVFENGQDSLLSLKV